MKMGLLRQFRCASMLLLLLTVLLGGVYPLLVMGIAQLAFPHNANGSLIEKDGKVIGSELLGQSFDNEWYFWGRPSAGGYNAAASGASNLGPSNEKWLASVLGRAQRLQRSDPQNARKIPIDLLTASASGLDPHISVEAALYQVPRVAKARHMGEKELKELIAKYTESFGFGKFAHPYVNVLKLNLALYELARNQGH